MHGQTLKYIFSSFFLFSIASCAAIPAEASSLEPRQGACLSALPGPNPVNDAGRISFQVAIDNRDRRTWFLTNLMDVHMDVHMDVPKNVDSTNTITVELTGRGISRWSMTNDGFGI